MSPAALVEIQGIGASTPALTSRASSTPSIAVRAALPSRIRTVHVTDAELDAWLTSPRIDDVIEPMIIVSHPDGSDVGSAAVARVRTLPCVIVGAEHPPACPPDHLDLVAESDHQLEQVTNTVERCPIAAITLALILRGADDRMVADGLVAESAAYSVLQAGPEFRRWRSEHPPRRRPGPTGPTVLMGRDGDVLNVVLNRPHVRNALNRQMRDELLRAFRLARDHLTITRVEVRGEGPAFCSGGDLDELCSLRLPSIVLYANEPRGTQTIRELRNLTRSRRTRMEDRTRGTQRLMESEGMEWRTIPTS